MVRISNCLISFLNLITLILAISIIGTSFYWKSHGSSECQQFLQMPLLILGAFLFILSILGFFGSCRHISSLLCLYLFLLTILIVGLICFTVAMLVVTNKGMSKAVSGKGIMEYRLGDYSNWLQRHFVDGKHWEQVKSCLIGVHVCRTLSKDANQDVAAFYNKHLSPIQSGCCKPPIYCGLTFKNATYWEMPKEGPAVPDSDCLTWNNNQDILCYDCKSCKGGVLENLKRYWKKIAILNISVLIFVLIVNFIGSCAYTNSKERRYQGYRGHYY